MDRHTVVKVGLGGSHLQGHPKSLSNLSCVWSKIVEADDLLLKRNINKACDVFLYLHSET